MSGTEKLRKENQSLRNEIADLKEKLQKISENLATMEEQHGRQLVEREMSLGRVHAVEFVSQQYDVLTKFKEGNFNLTSHRLGVSLGSKYYTLFRTADPV